MTQESSETWIPTQIPITPPPSHVSVPLVLNSPCLSMCVPQFPHLFIEYFLQLLPFSLLSLNDFPIVVHDALCAWPLAIVTPGNFPCGPAWL